MDPVFSPPVFEHTGLDVNIQDPLRSAGARQVVKYALLAVLVIAWFIAVTTCVARIGHFNPAQPATGLNHAAGLLFHSRAVTGLVATLSRLGSVLAALALAAPLGVFFLSTTLAQRFHRRTLD
jgi:hypothetical protein